MRAVDVSVLHALLLLLVPRCPDHVFRAVARVLGLALPAAEAFEFGRRQFVNPHQVDVRVLNVREYHHTVRLVAPSATL